MIKILILCTGNSCRSQMAMGYLQSLDDHLDVHSAGTRPVEQVHPLAVKAMAEVGISLEREHPKSVEVYLGEPWDYVITVCGGANETCPAFSEKVGKRLHIGFDDPASAIGSEEEKMAVFRRVRDEIMNRMKTFHEEITAKAQTHNNEECLICQSPLEYLPYEVEMECHICHQREMSRTRCVNGHYVCNDCHTQGITDIISYCLGETSADPIHIVRQMMAMPFCHMHGPEHHIMVGSALLTAFRNAGGEIDLPAALIEMQKRGKCVPGGACGFWGACGAGISIGMFMSILTRSTPLTHEPWGLSNQMTSASLKAIGIVGGPRCCKRNTYLAIQSTIDFVKEHFGIEMVKQEVKCIHYAKNNQCIAERCPFFP